MELNFYVNVPVVFNSAMLSPLLDFVQELPEDRLSEVVWQTAGHVVFDEGFNDSLQEKRGGINPQVGRNVKYYMTLRFTTCHVIHHRVSSEFLTDKTI